MVLFLGFIQILQKIKDMLKNCQIVVFRGTMGLRYYCYSENGTECPIDNLDTYTLVLVAQAVVREYEKTLKK